MLAAGIEAEWDRDSPRIEGLLAAGIDREPAEGPEQATLEVDLRSPRVLQTQGKIFQIRPWVHFKGDLVPATGHGAGGLWPEFGE